MADLKLLRGLVQQFVADAPPFLIDRQLNSSARRLCQEAYAWCPKIQMDLLLDSADQQVSAELLPIGSVAVAILEVRLAGADRPLSRSNGWISSGSGTPACTEITSPLSFRVGPIPDQSLSAIVTVAVKPDRDKYVVPDELLDMSDEGIAQGAVARLKFQAGNSWYDPATAPEYEARFRAEIRRVRTLISKRFSNGDARASSNGFV